MSDPAQPATGDHVVRAMTTDGGFRIIAAVTTDTVRDALAAQHRADELGLRLGELITAAVLLRETTQPARRVQLLWRDRRGGALVADALPDGANRGLVNPGSDQEVSPRGDHLLQVDYTLPNGALHQATVGIPDGEDMSSALMRYLHQSEQILSMTGVVALPGPQGVRLVGGYVIQLLPEATREVIDTMTDHVGNLEPFPHLLEARAATPRALIAALMGDLPYQELAASALRFGCTCSEVRVMTSILTLPDDEIASMLAGDPLEVRCDACGRQYVITPDALRAFRDARDPGRARA
jgi:molecular chaperone Hsp33